MPKVMILVGASGHGKSTWASKQLENAAQYHVPLAIVSADYFFEDNETGKYVFNPSKLQEAHNECLANFVQHLYDRMEVVIVDNTNLSEIICAPYVAVAKAFGYQVEFVYFKNFHGNPKGLKPEKIEAMEKNAGAFFLDLVHNRVFFRDYNVKLAD